MTAHDRVEGDWISRGHLLTPEPGCQAVRRSTPSLRSMSPRAESASRQAPHNGFIPITVRDTPSVSRDGQPPLAHLRLGGGGTDAGATLLRSTYGQYIRVNERVKSVTSR